LIINPFGLKPLLRGYLKSFLILNFAPLLPNFGGNKSQFASKSPPILGDLGGNAAEICPPSPPTLGGTRVNLLALVQKGRRQEAEAVRPRVAVRRKGMLTKRGRREERLLYKLLNLF